MKKRTEACTVLESINENELVQLTKQLIQIPSVNPPGNEEKIANFIAQKMKHIGLEVSMDYVLPNRPNVYGMLRGEEKGPTLILNGHMDTVPSGENWKKNPFGGEELGGNIYGRGSVDMKGSIAAMIMAVKAIIDSRVRLRGNLLITTVVDEEVNQLGTKHMITEKAREYDGNFAIVGEPTNLKVGITCRGLNYYEITTIGKAAHAGNPEKGINAICKMCRVIEALNLVNKNLKKKKHRLLEPPTITVGTILGGEMTCIVPDVCKITVDRRWLPSETTKAIEEELTEMINKLKNEDEELIVKIKRLMESPPMEVSEDEPVVRSVRKAAGKILGHKVGLCGLTGVCDGNILVNEANIPTVIFGPGDTSQPHSADEHIQIDQIVCATKVYSLSALDLLGIY